MENEDLIRVLEKEIETRILPTKNYPYVPASAVRARLNEAFGGRWNTHILSSEVINDDNVLVLLELACTVGDKKIVKESFGSAPIHKYNSGPNQGKPVNLGDAYNNALMDSIKAAAKQFGIGNKQLDVKKDPKTGRYIRVDGVESSTPDNVIPITQKQDAASEEKINKLKEKLEANKSKTTVTEPKPEIKEPVVEKKDDVPVLEEPFVKKQESEKVSPEIVQPKTEPDANPDDVKAAKIIELRKKLEANKKGVTTNTEIKTEPKPELELASVPEKEDEDPGYGFDYSGIGGSNEEAPKNTQKLVILNLAKMQKLSPEEYIKKALGKEKAIDELTAEEAGQVVRSGLSKFE